VQAQNTDQLHAYDCYQKVAEPQDTEYHKSTYVYNTGTVSQA